MKKSQNIPTAKRSFRRKKTDLPTELQDAPPVTQKQANQNKRKIGQNHLKLVTKHRKISIRDKIPQQQVVIRRQSKGNDGVSSIFSVLNAVSSRKQSIIEQSKRYMKAGESSIPTASQTPSNKKQEFEGCTAQKRMSILMKQDFERKVFAPRKSSFCNMPNQDFGSRENVSRKNLITGSSQPKKTTLIQYQPFFKADQVRKMKAGQPSIITKSTVNSNNMITDKLNRLLDQRNFEFQKVVVGKGSETDRLPKIRLR